MGIDDYFRSLDTMTPREVRELQDRHQPAEYTLLDVRQPGEYQQQHIPGAQLIPLAELADRVKELDPAKPVVAY